MMKRARRRRWSIVGMYGTTVQRSDAQLTIGITGGESGKVWVIACVESPRGVGHVVNATDLAAVEQGMKAVFDQHAHEVLPPQRSLAAAQRLAERYAAWWLGSRATHFECACKPIAKAKKRAA